MLRLRTLGFTVVAILGASIPACAGSSPSDLFGTSKDDPSGSTSEDGSTHPTPDDGDGSTSTDPNDGGTTDDAGSTDGGTPGWGTSDADTPDADTAATGMTFFVSSKGNGIGGNFGGLKGADDFCQKLASAAGAGNRIWRAYLSTSALGEKSVNAKDRIGKGPWQNRAGILVATDVNQLHDPAFAFPNGAVQDENGKPVPDANRVVYTGTKADGTNSGLNCVDWMSVDPRTAASTGFTAPNPNSKDEHWNSGGLTSCVDGVATNSGRIYCFATN